MKKEIGEIALIVVGSVVCVIFIIELIFIGFARQEITECNKWQQEAAVYPGYYLSKWQKDQCDAHKIFINAEVK